MAITKDFIGPSKKFAFESAYSWTSTTVEVEASAAGQVIEPMWFYCWTDDATITNLVVVSLTDASGTTYCFNRQIAVGAGVNLAFATQTWETKNAPRLDGLDMVVTVGTGTPTGGYEVGYRVINFPTQ